MLSNQPMIFQTSRTAFLVVFAIFLCMLGLSIFLSRQYGLVQPFLPLMPYLIFVAYLLLSRRLIAKHHRNGCRAFKRGDLESAISEMQASYAFFQRHPWLDRFRCLTMLSTSGMSYRELALVNIGFFQAQSGRGNEAKAAYRRAVAEFPESVVGRQAMKMIETFESPSTA